MNKLQILSCLVIPHLLMSAPSTTQKIDEKAKTLEEKLQTEKKIHGKLHDIANEIMNEEKDIEKIKDKIEDLSKNINESQEVVQRKNEYLEKLTKDTQVLSTQKKDLEQKIIKIIAEDFSFYLVSDSGYLDNEDGILVDEVLQKMDTILRKEFGKLATDYKQVNDQIYSQSQEIKTLHGEIQFAKNKKDVVLFVEKIAKEQEKNPYRIMHFSIYHELTAETVPTNPKEKMKYHWEASHYKKELGDIVLDRLLNISPYKDFGVELNSENIDSHIQKLRDDRVKFIDTEAYRKEVFISKP